VRTAAEGHQHFDGLYKPGEPVPLPRLGADRASLFAEVGITHVLPSIPFVGRAAVHHFFSISTFFTGFPFSTGATSLPRSLGAV
jgi:hypothetical protein